jgi:hypothetical protein
MPSAAAKLAVADDPTFYPTEDDMGESSLQRLISELLRGLIERWLETRGTPAFVGANQFFYWEQFNSSEGIAPDIYVLPGAPRSPKIGSWKVWETHLVPSFALEIVSSDVDKDYLASPAKYARLGVEELIVFDPDFALSRSRVRFQVFRRTKRGFLRVESSDADRVKSRVLGCYLRVVGKEGALRVRLGTGFNGETLFPTEAEAAQAKAEAAQAKAEAAQAKTEAAQAKAEAAQAKAEAAQAELKAERQARAALEAEIARLRAAPNPRKPARK